MIQAGRKYEATDSYRYGFNGMEKDNELKGDQNSYTTEFREYDPRIGRWFSVDPMRYAQSWQSPYIAFSNNPINRVDPSGNIDDNPVYYKTKRGDTYSSVAKRYNVSIRDLRKWNGYEDKNIPTGANLIVGWGDSEKPTVGGNGGFSKTEEPAVNTVTDAAEKATVVYNKVANFLKDHPGAVYLANNAILKPAAWAIKQTINSDPNNHSWIDLFNIWFFELNNGVTNDKITYGTLAKTTMSLMRQEGVTEARQIAMARAQVGNTNPVSWSWTFGVKAAKDAVATGNLVTAFLGSYTITVTTHLNPKTKAMYMSFQVMNVSGWESATRFRLDHNGDGVHDGIIPDKARGEGLQLGGNLEEKWIWSEYYPSWHMQTKQK